MATIYPLLHLTPCTKAMQDEYIDSWLLGVRVDHDPCEDVRDDPDYIDLTGWDLGNRNYEDWTAGPMSIAASSVAATAGAPVDPDLGLTPSEKAEAHRKLIRRVDLVLIPWLSLLYLLAFLDRTNIGNAKIADLTTDIPMDNKKYSFTLMIFFIAYAVFETLANILMRLFRPSRFLPITMILCGVCMTSMGFVTNWSGLMTARFFLGVTEAGLYPGVNYYMSCWYRRDEFAVRAAIFLSAAALSGSFGGLLAAAIHGLDGICGLAGWRWIFILEGSLTVIAGIASFKMVHDFPDQAKFLSVQDRDRVIFRLAEDKQSIGRREEFSITYLWAALKDFKTFLGMGIFMGPMMALYSIGLFLPTIISNLSLTRPDDVVRNQLLTVPPYAVATVVTIAAGFFSDRHKRRGVYNMYFAMVGTIGFLMLAVSTNPGVQYAGTFFGTAGVYASIPITVAWVANNVEGVYKRGVVMGLVIGSGNLNGIVSSALWFDAPSFSLSHSIVIIYLGVCLGLGSYLLHFVLQWENTIRASGWRRYRVEGKSRSEVDMLGDQHPDFRYIL